MKPTILKTPGGRYVCEIPVDNEPEDESPDLVWWKWAACGFGDTPTEAYDNWTKD